MLDIICIAETKLDNSFTNSQFKLDNYRLFRKDRTAKGGGIICYVRSDIPCRQMDTYESQKSTEMIVLELKLKTEKWLIAVCYKRPTIPNKDLESDIISFHEQASPRYENIIIIGDLKC